MIEFMKTLSTILVSCMILPFMHGQKSNDWTYGFEVYGMAASIEGDASIGRIQGAPVDVGFDQILETLDLAAMLHFEAMKNNRWGFYVDYSFMDLGANLQNSRGGILDADIRQGIMEAMVVRRLTNGKNTFEVYGGLRWWDMDLDVILDPVLLPGTANPSVQEDWIDIVVGGRILVPLSDQWTLTGQLDLGGLGIESDFTLSASLGVQYWMTETMVLDIKYKALWVDYESGTLGSPGSFAYDTVTHGPYAGVIFKF